MARMLIELSEGLYEKLADHVSAGKYRDIDQAIEVAILNQLKLESRESGLLSGEGVAAEPDPRTSPGPTDEQADRAPSDEYLAFLQLPDGSCGAVAAPGPEDLIFTDYISEEQMFLWGQFNRILPGKVGLRILNTLVAESDETYVPLTDYRYVASNVARGFGEFVKSLDDHHGRKRSDRFSNGLPIGPDRDKSMSRYRNHFLGRKRKSDNVLDGYLARLKFINIFVADGGTSLVGLTEAGLAFSKIHNELMTGAEADWPLSNLDIEFYLEHVLGNVPEERSALVEVLGYVDQGHSHPAQIDEMLARRTRVRPWTRAMVVTNRAGTLSRLWELKLVTKTGDKANKFSITLDGRRFLEQTAKLEEYRFEFS